MTAQEQAAVTPDEAIQLLKSGNKRFLAAKHHERDYLAQLKASPGGQHPFAAILGCIDSRVPAEIVFDQGFGDIFVARVAGNFANTDIIGSFEFATKIAGSKVILVLGHTECGAVMGACDDVKFGNLTHTLANLAPAIYASNCEGPRNSSNINFLREVTENNVRLTMQSIAERSAVLTKLIDEGNLKIAGAIYDIDTGKARFLE